MVLLIAASIMMGILKTEVPVRVPRWRTAISGPDTKTATCTCIASICRTAVTEARKTTTEAVAATSATTTLKTSAAAKAATAES